jgi:ComF family protein
MNFLKKILEIIFPSHCLFCSKIVSKKSLFCEICWPKLQFINEPKCTICGYPFEFQGLSLLCAKCLTKKPSFDKAISVFRYNHILRSVIGNLKYRDQTFLAQKFAPFLLEKIKNEIDILPIIVAVPLHKKRLQKRKFNQAVLLAKNLQKLAPQLDFFSDFLIRTKNTKPQATLRKKQRENNLKNVFAINKKYLNQVRGKNFLIIDDVTTTGATLENCAKVLKKHGAKKIIALTIAKTAFFTN